MVRGDDKHFLFHANCGIRIPSEVNSLPVLSLPSSVFLRSSIRISYEGMAVFHDLRRPAGLFTRLHLSLPGVGGWRPDQDLAEGDLSQEVIWRL